MNTNKGVYDSKDLVSSVPGPRKYYLSVRLNEEDLGRYLTILEWYSLNPVSYQADNRSEGFRELLERFCQGLADYGDIPESYYEAIVTRPPKWKREPSEPQA